MPISDKVKAAFEGYCSVTKRTEERQAEWNAKTKDLVFRTLSAIVTELRSSATAGHMKHILATKEESVRNFDTVAIGFPPMPTDIVYKKGNAIIGATKIGGHLFYSQVFNGKILVGISFPYVTELQDAKPNMGIALLDPEEITEEMIFRDVEHFLQAMADAECSPSMEDEIALSGYRLLPMFTRLQKP